MKSTKKGGVTEINSLVNPLDFYSHHVDSELRDAHINSRPIIKAACIKFVITFRNQLPVTFYGDLLQMFVRFLSADNEVVHTYAAVGIDRLLASKDNGVVS